MRLVTFNILHGRTPGDDVVDPARLAAAVRALDPDVLALQEVDLDGPRSGHVDLAAVAAEAMAAVSHRFVPALSCRPGEHWRRAGTEPVQGAAGYGIALLSRYPVLDWQVVRLPWFRLPLPVWRDGRVRRWDDEARVAVLARLETPGGQVTVAATHLSLLPGWAQYQLWRLTRRLAPARGPVVLLGDLNLTGEAPARVTGYRPLARHPTVPVEAPRRQIDHVLLRGWLGAVRATAAPAMALSDHRPLIVDVTGAPGTPG
ncbi:MAG: Endonuclease/exonuclease/phosphatase [Friedmanniella sp.]|nr:Endonuclease/exonuclease/phosphatase [Friedmanniella sp.]